MLEIMFSILAVVGLFIFLWVRAVWSLKTANDENSMLRSRIGAQEHKAKIDADTIRNLEYKINTHRWEYERGEDRDSLKSRYDDLMERLKLQKERMKHLRHKNNELTDELFGRSILNQIRFDAFIPEKGWTKTTFKLGRGPCGLTVRALKWEEMDDRYILTQQCTNGETKRFEYMKVDVRGRREFREGRTEF